MMALELQFRAYSDKETVGDLVATWDAGQPTEFVHKGSVNLEHLESVDDFFATAAKLRDEKPAPEDDKIAILLAELVTKYGDK